jgi:UPF0271 protein
VRIDVNADASESYGRFKMGNDDELLPLVSSVNVACGYHGGDPGQMRKAVRIAKEHGISLGAHPGFPDLMGFGRRALGATHEEIVDMVTYQVGALLGFARAEGVRLAHMKPHGTLNLTIWNDETLLLKVAEAIVAVQPDLALMILAGPQVDLLRRHGFSVISEVVPDLEYDDEGNCLIDRNQPDKDPAYVAERAVQMAQGIIKTVGGRQIEVQSESLCLHGDRGNAVEIAKAVRAALAEAGCEVAAPGVAAATA